MRDEDIQSTNATPSFGQQTSKFGLRVSAEETSRSTTRAFDAGWPPVLGQAQSLSMQVSGGRLEAVRVLTLALFRELEHLDGDTSSSRNRGIDFIGEVQRFEACLIHSALVQTGGKQRRAARLLGIN